jgi:hypothetical protein
MVEVKGVKQKIAEFIEKNGPSLPIQIAKEMNMNSIFVSAFLSELVDDKKVKMSSLKLGGTHLYLLNNQEQQLERFYNYLHPKEAEAYLLLKENKVLKDSDQDPAIRVALRAIKDFSVGFSKNNEIYWRYLFLSEPEASELIEQRYYPKKEKIPEIIQEIKETIDETPKIESIKPELTANLQSSDSTESEITLKKSKVRKQRSVKTIEKTQKLEFENPLAINTLEIQKEKPKSDFVLKTIEFLKNNHFKIIEEKEYKTKEYFCIVQINTALGPISFLTQAKEKKSVSEQDLQKFLSQAQSIPLPALILYTGDLSKKAQEYLEKYSSILKAKKIE